MPVKEVLIRPKWVNDLGYILLIKAFYGKHLKKKC